MSARLSAQTARFLLVVGEYDQRRGWEAWDCHNMAMWLSWKCAISPVAARQQVRVALALREMPLLAERFAAGQLRYSQVRAISQTGTPETVASLVEFAECCSSAQLESITRAFRRSRRAVEETAAGKPAATSDTTTTMTGTSSAPSAYQLRREPSSPQPSRSPPNS